MREEREDKRHEHSGKCRSLLSKVFIAIGILTVTYLFITEVLMRVLAMMTIE